MSAADLSALLPEYATGPAPTSRWCPTCGGKGGDVPVAALEGVTFDVEEPDGTVDSLEVCPACNGKAVE